jgi:hypothetical protein
MGIAIAAISTLLLVGLPMLLAHSMAAQFCQRYLRYKKQPPYWIVLLSAVISPFLGFFIIASVLAFFDMSWEPFKPHFWKSLATHGLTLNAWLKILGFTSFAGILSALLTVVVYRRRFREIENRQI